jgi:peptide/nickel transport system ATP-binding protein
VSGVSTVESESTASAGATQQKPVLEVRDLSVVYDVYTKAVDHVDIELAPGETLGLAGESGSGKSTLALGLCRLLRPPAVITSGSVIYRGSRVAPEGVDLLELSSRELRKLRWREISIVFQSAMNALNPVLRIRDQLGDALDAHLHLSREGRHDRLNMLLDLVGIPRERLRSYPHELSGGMRQRVMIAMALASEPAVLLCDEPTTALDVTVQAQVLDLLDSLRAELRLALVFVSHDLAVVRSICEEIAVMYAGRFVETGPTAALLEHPRHPYTLGLRQAVVDVDDAGRAPRSIPGELPEPGRLPPGCPFNPRCAYADDACRHGTIELESHGEVGRAVACLHSDRVPAP